MQPVRANIDTYYIVQDLAVARQSGGHAMDWRTRMAALCEGLDPRRSDATPADHAGQLMAAFDLVDAVGSAARAGRAPAMLDCNNMNWNGDPPVDQAACLRELATLHHEQVGWVQGCRPRR